MKASYLTLFLMMLVVALAWGWAARQGQMDNVFVIFGDLPALPAVRR